MKVFYNPHQSVRKIESYSPSAYKPELVVNDWVNRKLEIELTDFKPLTSEDLQLAHDQDFVRKVLSCDLPNGFGTKDKEVADSLLWTNGSLYHASLDALKTNSIACSPTSGFHHATFNKSRGFCTFNGIAVTVMKLQKGNPDLKIAVVDLDCHVDDGTRQIVNHLDLDLDLFSFGDYVDKSKGRLTGFISDLKRHMESLRGFDLIIYQAGADPHEYDPLGGYLSTEKMRLRDEIVFSYARKMNIPVVWNLAGGYQDLEVILELHRNTALEAIKALKSGI